MKRVRTSRSFRKKKMTRPECVKKFKAAAKRFVRAERELGRAGEAYDAVRDIAFKAGWKMPRTILSNPLLR